MVTYLKDIMFTFKEETQASALSGGKYTESNCCKMEKKFDVTWMDFQTSMNIPELAKITTLSKLHALLCGNSENFCGLDAVKHPDASLTMINRYVQNSMTAWLASNPSVLYIKFLPDPVPSSKGKAWQLDEGQSEKSDRLTIKLPATSKMKEKKQENFGNMAKYLKNKETAPMQYNIEDAPLQLNVSKKRKVPQMQKNETTT
ncbi:hypothetical protein EDB19DRAFT_1831171 [Suillus lakei]|nr:hypothetical protein EDB19DRAFT_1831171 [Suillus lakei]